MAEWLLAREKRFKSGGCHVSFVWLYVEFENINAYRKSVRSVRKAGSYR